MVLSFIELTVLTWKRKQFHLVRNTIKRHRGQGAEEQQDEGGAILNRLIQEGLSAGVTWGRDLNSVMREI